MGFAHTLTLAEYRIGGIVTMANKKKTLIKQYPRFASLIETYRGDVKGALKHLKNSVYTLTNTELMASAQLFHQLFGLEAIYQSGVNLSQTIWKQWFEVMPITCQDALTYIGQDTLPMRDTLMKVVYQKSNDAGWADETYLGALSFKQIESFIEVVEPTKDGLAYLLNQTPELTKDNTCYIRSMAIHYAVKAAYEELLIGLKDQHDELALWQAQHGHPLIHLVNNCSMSILQTLLAHGYGRHLMPFKFFAQSRKLRPLLAYWAARQEQVALCELLAQLDQNTQAALVIGGYHPDWLVESSPWLTKIRRCQLKHPDVSRSELLERALPHLTIVDPD